MPAGLPHRGIRRTTHPFVTSKGCVSFCLQVNAALFAPGAIEGLRHSQISTPSSRTWHWRPCGVSKLLNWLRWIGQSMIHGRWNLKAILPPEAPSNQPRGRTESTHDSLAARVAAWDPTNCPVADVDGEVSFREGQFDMTDPVGDGLPSVLIPGDDVILTIEGRTVTKPVAVWAGKSVQVRPRQSSQPVRKFQIQLSPDRMAAYISVEASGPPGYRVKEAGPSHVVHLCAEPLPGLQVNPSPEEVEQALKSAGVLMGVDQAAISRALENPGTTQVKVACGRPSQPGVPGRVQSMVDEHSLDDPPEMSPRVEPGQLLARLIPPQEGHPGFDVSGRRLAPVQVERLGLVSGYGTRISADGTEVIATTSGRPVILQVGPNAYRATVVPVLELGGPLVDGSQPYQFEGDVVVNGDVGGGVSLRAGGWIWVRGSVRGASLEAGQGITVERSVKWSRLVTRATRQRLIPLQQQFGLIVSDLRQMRGYAELIIRHPRYAELSQSRSFGEVMLVLAREQFDHLGQRIANARSAISDLAVLRTQVDMEAILNTLEHRLYAGTLQSMEDLTQIIDAVTAATQRAADILGAGGRAAPVHASILIGSEVDAEGDVIVFGSGAEQTVVTAHGLVQAKNLRDVRVTTDHAIETETVAASTRDAMVLRVSPGGHIHVGLALKETELAIGRWTHLLAPDSRNVRVHSDAGGRVSISSDWPARHGHSAVLWNMDHSAGHSPSVI